jgi:alanine dehydrogenase
MIIKVKEPLAPEIPQLKDGQIVFTYFHFAASRELLDGMISRRSICIAYETIGAGGNLPLLTPMSEVAGRLSIQQGAKYLENPQKGRGILLSGVPGVLPANIVVLGGGVVGTNAARLAAGLGARVIILDINVDRLRHLAEVMPANVCTLYSNAYNVRDMLQEADLLIGAVLISGARAPVLVSRSDLKLMKPGSVIVDVAVDQGGCVETTRPTTHSNPTYIEEGVVHYCVANMPGAVGRTSTYALTNVTLPYALQIADLGWRKAAAQNPALAAGVNVAGGKITHEAVAQSFSLSATPLAGLLG